MNTPDKTLLQFLEDADIGIYDVPPENTLPMLVQARGFNKNITPDVEFFEFRIERPMGNGELFSLITTYFIRSGYTKMEFKCWNRQGYSDGFSDAAIVETRDSKGAGYRIEILFSGRENFSIFKVPF